MKQIELAIKYLNQRAVNASTLNSTRTKQLVKVLPASEVEAVLLMVQEDQFRDFYNAMAEKGHPDFQ